MSANPPQKAEAACPFLARSAATGMPLCVSNKDDVIGISSRYASTYCLSAQHVRCPRFIHARRLADPVPARPHDADSADVKRSPEAHGTGETQLEPTPAGPGTKTHPAASVEKTQSLPPLPARPAAPPAAEQTQPLPSEEPSPTITSPVTGSYCTSSILTLTGTGRPHRRVRLLDAETPVSMAVVGTDGIWRETLYSVTPGDHTYLAEALDGEGRVIGASNPCTVTVGAPSQETPQGRTGALLARLQTLLRLSKLRGSNRAAALGVGGALLLVVAGVIAVTLSQRGGGSRAGAATAGGGHGPAASRTAARPTSVRPAIPPVVTPEPTSTPRPIPTPTATPGPRGTGATGSRRKVTPRPTVKPRPTATPRPAPTPGSVRGSPAASRPGPRPTPLLVAPALTWHFAALRRQADQVILVLSNPNRTPVLVQVRITGETGVSAKKVPIPAASGLEMELTTQAASAALSIRSTAPIVPQRLVIRRNRVQSFYGHPGP